MEYLRTLTNWIQQEVKLAKANGVVVGISGGIDSALVAYLAKQSFPENFIALMMPINKDRDFDLNDGIELANKFQIKYKIIDLYDEYQALIKKFKIKNKLVQGNIQARLRMLTLYAFAQNNNYLVLGTDNRAEYKLGYFTKYGDGGCDLLPIAHLYKSEVFEYAKKVGVPESIINKKPSAGLWEEQTDEDELGFRYDDFEKYEKNEKILPSIKKKIQEQILKTEHKRIPIPMPPTKNNELSLWINNIKDINQKEKIEEIIRFVKNEFPNLELKIKWNQLVFILNTNRTFILGVGISKEFINIAPEEIIVKKFKREIKQNKYSNTKNLIKINNNQKVNLNFVKKIIKNNISDKKELKTFWR